MVRIYGFEGGMVVKVHNPNTPEAEARGGPDSDKYVLHSKMLSENKGEKKTSTPSLIMLGLGVVFS